MTIFEHELAKIANQINSQMILCEGKEWDSEQMESYFLSNYYSVRILRIDDNNFLTYKIGKSYIWIQDCVIESPIIGIRSLMNKLLSFQDTQKKDLKMAVQVTNISMINLLIRNNFKILEKIGYNYIIYKKYKGS